MGVNWVLTSDLEFSFYDGNKSCKPVQIEIIKKCVENQYLYYITGYERSGYAFSSVVFVFFDDQIENRREAKFTITGEYEELDFKKLDDLLRSRRAINPKKDIHYETIFVNYIFPMEKFRKSQIGRKFKKDKKQSYLESKLDKTISCDFKNADLKDVESALAKLEVKQQVEAQAEFNDVIRAAGLKPLASARDRDVIVDLWQLKWKNNSLEAVWLLKTTSSRQITGGGTGSSLINQLVFDENIVNAEGMGGGNVWFVNDKPVRLPRPYGQITRREFQLSGTLTGKATFIITERIYFDGQSENEGEIFTFKFPNVPILEKK